MSSPVVGVFALQGDVREHLRVLTRLGVEAVTVRRPAELARCHGLVLPGGESTTMAKLARTFGLLEPLRHRIGQGLPVLGTCAGMIMLADRIEDGVPGQETIGGLDVTVRRNAFGRQVDSFEEDLAVAGTEGGVRAVFIRAPWVERVGPAVDVLARSRHASAHAAAHPTAGPADREDADPRLGRIVAVRQGPLMATSFHPEVGGGDRIHRLFLDLIEHS